MRLAKGKKIFESGFENLTVNDTEQSAFESDDQLVVALDFGTTFSGIAYAFKNNQKPDVVSIMDWPGK